jgi:DNA (cytosine-5)-methyltransferase 1
VLNGLDLFTGIGGLTLALSEWIKPVAYCESDRYAQAVLLSRIWDGQLPRAGIWDDVTSLDGSVLPPIDIIYGGFPCQDISTAGNGAGLAGKRSGLFFEIMRLAEEVEPTFIFLENVPAIRTRGLDRIGKKLAERGYDCRWCTLSAAQIGAPHKRERWFCLAYNTNNREQIEECVFPRGQATKPERVGWWDTEPELDRMANGVPGELDRIKGLGNAVVPQQAREAFKQLLGYRISQGN